MKLHNLRIGFATNSSSSHSVILVPQNSIKDDDVYSEDSYGWEQFVLASPEAKIKYIAAGIMASAIIPYNKEVPDDTNVLVSDYQNPNSFIGV